MAQRSILTLFIPRAMMPCQVSGQADGAGLVLSLEGKDAAQLEAAHALLASGLPPGARLVSVQHDATALDRLR